MSGKQEVNPKYGQHASELSRAGLDDRWVVRIGKFGGQALDVNGNVVHLDWDNKPVLCGRAEGQYVIVWCPFCKRDHSHGRHEPGTGCRFDPMRPDKFRCACPAGTGDGHRVAHCDNPDSPFSNSGYIICEDNDSPLSRRWPDTGKAKRKTDSALSGPAPVRAILESRRCTPQCLLALEPDGKCACPCRGVHHGALADADVGGNAVAAEQGSSLLSGKWFHTTEECSCGGRRVSWQGCIIGEPSSGLLLVQFFEWLLGEKDYQKLITLADFMAEQPILYDTNADMKYSYEYGSMSHRCEVFR